MNTYDKKTAQIEAAQILEELLTEVREHGDIGWNLFIFSKKDDTHVHVRAVGMNSSVENLQALHSATHEVIGQALELAQQKAYDDLMKEINNDAGAGIG